EGTAAVEGGVVVAGGPDGGLVPAGAARPGRVTRARATADPLLGEDLLRPGRARAAAPGRLGRDRTSRAALPVPGRGGRRAHALVPGARRGRVGAGGAAEHG